MEITRVHNDQITGVGSKNIIIDTEMGTALADIDKFDLLMPVCQEADVLIG